MARSHRVAFAALAALLVPAGSVAGQSVESVIDDMYEAFEERAAGIDDYTIVQSVMGFETTLYFVKEMVEGRPVFRLQRSAMGSMAFSLGGEDVGQGDVFLYGPDLIEHGRYAGTEDVEGVESHVLAVDDLSALDISEPSGPDDVEFEPRSGRIFVDTETFVLRRLIFVGDLQTPDGPKEVTMQMDMTDIRDVNGFLFPYRTVMTTRGFGAVVDPEMQAQLEEMERRLASVPADQRAMMGAQLDRLRDMMGGGGDAMTVEIVVREIRVNAGPPRG